MRDPFSLRQSRKEVSEFDSDDSDRRTDSFFESLAQDRRELAVGVVTEAC
jgi:hypothetical protein